MVTSSIVSLNGANFSGYLAWGDEIDSAVLSLRLGVGISLDSGFIPILHIEILKIHMVKLYTYQIMS